MNPPPRKLSIREKAEKDREILKIEAEREELKNQSTLFDMKEDWREIWKGMPEFNQKDLTPFQSILIHFDSLEDRKSFSNLVGQTVTDLTKSIWHPKAVIGKISDKRYRRKI